uniref:Uncharacterized protein n=1 Tax=Ditylum brightwellii TaxID=49249 RepID=A0A7S1ZG99_9STRA|mmetsp:Transcript_31300/g.46706  ORF Transcript_31300/g.46706 Transcript_31300/m.46706 type:complete len:271 (+) Transcript_31300:1589-2401(+)
MSFSVSSCHDDDKKKKTTKSVHFPTDEDSLSQLFVVEALDDFSEQEKKNLWFSRSDYQFSKSCARVIAKESERYGHSRHLDAVYNDHHHSSTTDHQDNEEQRALGRLKLWALQGHSRRGLEFWANSQHGSARKQDSFQYVQRVLRAHTELKLQDALDQDTKLRDIGCHLSRKARMFAERMGQADQHAARFELGLLETDDFSVCVSPRQLVQQQQQQRRNLGLSNTHKRVVQLPKLSSSSAAAAISPSRRRVSTTTTPKLPRVVGRSSRVA